MKKIILGIDEVGRGPWAGPLLVGAVILGEDFEALPEYAELTDSKKLTAKKRERLAAVITEKALATGIGRVTAAEIDEYGLGAALKRAARRAVKQILAQKIKFDEIVIDGTINLLVGTPLDEYVTLLPKADMLVKEVSAASIIAKVARDNYMVELAAKYPEYGFEKHVGYGTAAHKAALEKYGPCEEHRRSFKPVGKMEINNTQVGKDAETVVAEWLENEGHEILARNYKTKWYEIDIISRCLDKIYFTEVKYRKNGRHGAAILQVTTEKRRQMEFAVKAFMSSKAAAGLGEYQPLLAVAGVEGTEFKLKTWFVLAQ